MQDFYHDTSKTSSAEENNITPQYSKIYTYQPAYPPLQQHQLQENGNPPLNTQPSAGHVPNETMGYPHTVSTSASYLRTYYGQPIAYPPLPQQQWPWNTEISVSQIEAYSMPDPYSDRPTKRKRQFDYAEVPAPEVVVDLTGSGYEEIHTLKPAKKRNNSTLPPPARDPIEAVTALMRADELQQTYYSEPDFAQGREFLPIPGSYPNSSQEMPPRLAEPDWMKYEPPSSSGTPLLPPPISSLPGHQPETTPVVLPEEPPLCPEQAELVELICSGRNVFYTGSAGCGKSTVLKAFTQRLRAMGKKVRVLAPTGRAALEVGGSTFWTYAGWTPEHLKKPLSELKQLAHGKFVFKRLVKDTDVLVFDEVSMIENHNFERLNELLKEAWHDPRRGEDEQLAFGGLQVIVTGDFCQLPPVRPFRYCIECGKELVEKRKFGRKTYTCSRHGEFRDEDKWAFASKAWQECNFVHVHLKQIHRQNDQEFIRMLQKCRIGDPLSPIEINKLMDHPCQVNNATRLFATREQVREVNQKMFKKLTGVNNWYWSRDVFIWRQERHPHLQWKGVRKADGPPGPEELRPLKALDEHRFEERVELKQGMLVVLLVNLDLAAGLCNGSQGLICGFEQFDAAKLPKAKVGNKNEPENRILGDRAQMKEQEIKAFINGKGARFKRWPVVRFHNGVTRVIFADCSITELGDEQPYSLLARTQIPLAPAWAMTIHKSQSLTMDRVIVNLSRAFEEGQVYVALSRATCLKGLKIEGDTDALTNGLGGNREVQRFLREKFGALDTLCSG